MRRARVVIATCVAAIASLAHAAPDDEPELSAAIVDGNATLRLSIWNAHAPGTAAQLAVRRLDLPAAAPVAATTLRAYRDTAESLAITVVMNGQEIWVGNDQEEPRLGDDGTANPTYFPGALESVRKGFRDAKLTARLPKHTTIGIVVYNDTTRVRLPPTPIATFDPAAFGTQKDYYTKLGTELVAGIRTGMTELRSSGQARRVLIVLGDGTDTNLDTARVALAQLKKEAAQDRIETYALTAKSPLSADEDLVEDFADRSTRVSRTAVLETAIPALIESLDNRYEADFATATLPRDTPLTLAVFQDTDRLGTIDITIPSGAALAAAASTSPSAATSPIRSIAFVVAALGLLGLAVGGLALRHHSRSP